MTCHKKKIINLIRNKGLLIGNWNFFIIILRFCRFQNALNSCKMCIERMNVNYNGKK